MAIASPLQFSTNRANAQRSTGPVTAEGKPAASHKALLPGEDPIAYQAHLRGYQLEYQPQDPYQRHLVDELASLAWRMDRVPVFEASLISLEVRLLTTDPELQPLVAGLSSEPELAAFAYRRLVEGKVLTSLLAQEQRLSVRIQRIKRELNQLENALPENALPENVRNEANSPAKLAPKVGRNDYCPCQSGLKYKRCCLNKVTETKHDLFDRSMASAGQ